MGLKLIAVLVLFHPLAIARLLASDAYLSASPPNTAGGRKIAVALHLG